MLTTISDVSINNSNAQTADYKVHVTPQMFKMFYTSLYEDKELAVMREVSANALDAHIEAGKEDVPIHISLPTKLSPELIIQDFGAGMTEDFIRNSYVSYGVSTKNLDNEQIGGFGIGAKSPLAIASTFTLETTRDGITTTVITFVDNSGPKYTIITKPAGEQPSGTIVRIPVHESQRTAALHRVAFGTLFRHWPVPPVFACGTKVPAGDVLVCADDVILEKFAYHSGYSSYGQCVLIGPFSYKIPESMWTTIRDSEYFKEFTRIKAGISQAVTSIFRFAVGELELSPNRERIEATPENTKKLLAKIKKICSSIEKVDIGDPVTLGHELEAVGGVWSSEFGSEYNFCVGIKYPEKIMEHVFGTATPDILTLARCMADLFDRNVWDYAHSLYPDYVAGSYSTYRDGVAYPSARAIISSAVVQGYETKGATLTPCAANKYRVALPLCDIDYFYCRTGNNRHYDTTRNITTEASTVVVLKGSQKSLYGRAINLNLLPPKNTLLSISDSLPDGATEKFIDVWNSITGRDVKILYVDDVKALIKSSASTGASATKAKSPARPKSPAYLGYLRQGCSRRIKVTIEDVEKVLKGGGGRLIVHSIPNTHKDLNMSLSGTCIQYLEDANAKVLYLVGNKAEQPKVKKFLESIQSRTIVTQIPAVYCLEQTIMDLEELVDVKLRRVRRKINSYLGFELWPVGKWPEGLGFDGVPRPWPLVEGFLAHKTTSGVKDPHLRLYLIFAGIRSSSYKDVEHLFTAKDKTVLRKQLDEYFTNHYKG